MESVTVGILTSAAMYTTCVLFICLIMTRSWLFFIFILINGFIFGLFVYSKYYDSVFMAKFGEQIINFVVQKYGGNLISSIKTVNDIIKKYNLSSFFRKD